MTSDEKEKFEHQDFLHLTPEDRKLMALSLARVLIEAGALEEKAITNIMEFGGYTLHKTDDGSFGIMDADGFYLKVAPEKFEKLIADFYYEES